MNNTENIGALILEICTEKQKYDKEYNDLMDSFVTKAYELVDLSEDLYQVEHTIKLNQISLKDYILNSEMCNFLKNNNINNYSIDDLKRFMEKYENQSISDITSYKLALELYEQLDKIKDIEDSKIDYEINSMSNILEDINNIKSIDKEKLHDLYNTLWQEIKEKYLDNSFIDEKIYKYIIQILNDIFNYYLYGNKEIPIDM